MAIARSSRNTVLAGLFVIVSIALGVAVVIVLAGIGDALRVKTKYEVDFSLLDGADGLEPGSPVKIGGQRVGQVLSWEFYHDQSPTVNQEGYRVPAGVRVIIEIDSSITLFEDAEVYLVRPLLGGNSQINIPSVGDGTGMGEGYAVQGSGPVLEEGERLTGSLGPPAFIAQSDYRRFQRILDNAARISDEMSKAVPDAREAVASARRIMTKFEEASPGWRGDIDATLASARAAAEKWPEVADNVKDGVEEGRRLIRSGQEMVDNTREPWRLTIEAWQRTAERFDRTSTSFEEDAWPRIVEVLEKVKEGTDTFVRAGQDAERLVAESMPGLRDMVADASMAAHQLKMTTVEVRASPWRLLYQPTKKELENELLYNSVRAYSDAVGRLKSASEALEAATARSQEIQASGGQVNAAETDRLVEKLNEAFAEYKQQEERFFKRWVRDAE